MIKASVLFPFAESDAEAFRGIENVEVSYGWSEDAEVLLGQPDAEQISRCKNLRLVQSTSAGVDGYVKIRDAFGENVTLTTVSGAFGGSISECVLGMVLSLMKNLQLFRDNQNACLWRDEGRQYSPVGQNLLVVGAGDIGTCVARIFAPFGCHTTGVKRHAAPPSGDFERFITLDGLDDALPEADIIVCALPRTESTDGLFDKRRLSLLKKSAILVNVGRGSLIDLDALTQALQEKRLFGAALDVTNPEPLPKEHPLWKCPNVIITPHATGGSFGHLASTEAKVVEICRENLIRYAQNRPLLNKVDFTTGYRSEKDRY